MLWTELQKLKIGDKVHRVSSLGLNVGGKIALLNSNICVVDWDSPSGYSTSFHRNDINHCASIKAGAVLPFELRSGSEPFSFGIRDGIPRYIAAEIAAEITADVTLFRGGSEWYMTEESLRIFYSLIGQFLERKK